MTSGAGRLRQLELPLDALGMPLHRRSLDESLARREAQATRDEFWHGEVFARVGAHLDDTPCQAFSENMKVQAGDDAVLYHDVFVKR